MLEVKELGVGKTAGLVVPKTMYVGNAQIFDRLALLTYHEGRSYREDVVRQQLGCSVVTHQGVDIERVLGRMHGDCSVLLDSKSLSKFDTIIFSDKLNKDLRRRNTVVAYCLGDGCYFCVSSFEFMEQYADNWLKGRVNVSQEAFK